MGGLSAHSVLKLPLNKAEEHFPICKISRASRRCEHLKQDKTVFWNECTPAHEKSLETIDRTLQALRGNFKMMRGALLILSGDCQQTLPVIHK